MIFACKVAYILLIDKRAAGMIFLKFGTKLVVSQCQLGYASAEKSYWGIVEIFELFEKFDS